MKTKKDECLMLGELRGRNRVREHQKGVLKRRLVPDHKHHVRGNHEPKILVSNETICLNSKVDGKQPSLTDRVYSAQGVSTAVTTTTFFQGNVLEDEQEKEDGRMSRYRIRKLTEGECYRLMGFQASDTEACRQIGQSKSQIYHQAGDSIVTTVLMGIFGELMGVDYEATIEDYAEKLHEEVAK